MLKLTRDVEKDGRVIPKGTRLVGAYNLPEGKLMTMVQIGADTIKLVVDETDTTMRKQNES